LNQLHLALRHSSRIDELAILNLSCNILALTTPFQNMLCFSNYRPAEVRRIWIVATHLDRNMEEKTALTARCFARSNDA
jgi:hypothetical protein